MASKFHLKQASDGQFHFNLLAGNGEIILSSELYKARQSAMDGIESVRKNSQRDSAFEIKETAAGKHHFVLKASNGQVIGQSQQYVSHAGAVNGVESVQKNAPGAELKDDS